MAIEAADSNVGGAGAINAAVAIAAPQTEPSTARARDRRRKPRAHAIVVETMLRGFKSAMGIEEKPKTAVEEMEEACCEFCPKLTYRQRLYGYATCFFLAFVLSIGSWMRLVDLVHGNPTPRDVRVRQRAARAV